MYNITVQSLRNVIPSIHCRIKVFDLSVPFSEHDDRTAPQFRNRKGRGSHKGRSYDRSRRDRQRGNHSGGFGGPGPRSRLDDTDGDVTMSDNSQDNSSQHRL